MAEKKELSLESSRFSRPDGSRALALQEENFVDSLHRMKLSENISQHDKSRNNSLETWARYKNEGADASSSTDQVVILQTQGHVSSEANVCNQENQQPQITDNSAAEQGSSQGDEGQEETPRNQHYDLSARSASQDLPGLIPPREIDTRPPDNESSDRPPNRRMAVCSVTDDASFERTKMRVYMKRF